MPQSVLIVEEDEGLRQLYLRVFAGSGLEIVVADSAKAGLNIIAKQFVDLVMVDLGMAGMNGIAFCQQLRQTKDKGHIKLVLMSGGGHGDTEKLKDLRLSAFADRPMEAKQLLLLVQSILAAPELEEA